MASTELLTSSRRRRPSTAHDERLPVAATDEAPPATASSAPARPSAWLGCPNAPYVSRCKTENATAHERRKPASPNPACTRRRIQVARCCPSPLQTRRSRHAPRALRSTSASPSPSVSSTVGLSGRARLGKDAPGGAENASGQPGFSFSPASSTPACLVTFLIARSLFASVAWYMMKAVVLLTYRFVAFRARKQHYYLLDFCYFVNILVIVFFVRVYVFGVTDVALFKALYAMCHGPLAWSVVIFDNKLIFHSVQHLISVFIHMSPAFLTMAVRWSRDPEFHALSAFGAEATENETGAPAGALGWAQKLGSDGGALVRDSFVPYYLGWIVVYSLVIFVLRAKRIRERAYETLFTYLIQKDGPLQRVIRRSTKNEKLQQLFYVSVHALFSLGTTLLAAVWWNWELGNLVFVGLIGATAIWNASGSSIKEVDFFQMEQAPNPDDETAGQRRE